MNTARTVEEVRTIVRSWKAQGHDVGLVPTMGFLHEGHESLIKRSAAGNARTVVSIFVNPKQFAPNEDLASYPRDLARDRAVCEAAGADLVFHPDAEAVYPGHFHTTVAVDSLTEGLCGKSRPTHFQGVSTVVCKLFNIVQPDRAYFGQKDAQQLAVIRRMTEDLNIPVEIVGCPIVRDPDGLAKSSRNIYLGAEERKAALALNRSLHAAEEQLAQGERNTAALVRTIEDTLNAEPLIRIDYIAVVDPADMQPVASIQGETLVALAAYVGKARLLDNTVLLPHS